MGIGRTLIVLGMVLIVAGVLVTLAGRFTPLGRLPGDLLFKRNSFTFYFPIMTSILLSVILTLIMWLVNRR
jgi:fumarate reductase subunit D